MTDERYTDDLDPPYDREDYADAEWDDEDICLTCNGTGTVNPLTAPAGHFVAVTSTCPHCDGLGRAA